jgi:hypothetical protein
VDGMSSKVLVLYLREPKREKNGALFFRR